MKSDYLVKFSGLKIGKHSFDFEVGKTFFTSKDYSPFDNGLLNVNLILDKKETMLVLDFEIKGKIFCVCHRCDAEMTLEVESQDDFIVRFGGEESLDENLVVLGVDAFEMDVEGLIYELIASNVPLRTVHEDGDCDDEVTALLDDEVELEENDLSEADPRWAELKKINISNNQK
jgi:uncharacterized protein